MGLEEWGRAEVTVWTILVLVWVWSSWRRWALVVTRAAGEGEERVEWRPCLHASKCPKDVAIARGGLRRTSCGVRRGIDFSQPARMAARKVDKTGEPKDR